MTYQQIRERLIKEVHELLPEHMNRLVWSKEQLDAFQTERLRDILRIAQQKTAWYKETLKNIDPEGFTLKDLRNLLTVDKKDVMNNWDEFVAVTGLTRDKAEGHLERFRNGSIDNPYYKDEYLFIATGGSSGKRGLFIWDREFLKETACINYRFLIDQEIKSNYNGPKRLAVIEAPTLLHGSQHLFTINVTAEMQVKSLSSIDTTDNNCAILNDYLPTYLVGFASSITEMAKAQLRGKLNINPRFYTSI